MLKDNKFNWFIGVVEEDASQDPLKLGRSRVRIFGSHTDDLSLIPTKTLPWAIPLHASNNPNSFSKIDAGRYVFGCYLDGDNSQQPCIIGTFPGIPQGEPKPGSGFSPLAPFYNDTESYKTYIEKLPVVPENSPAMKLQTVGKPTTPANAQTVANTVVGWTNSDLVHSCDFRFQINLDDMNIGTIENPITLIQKAIKDANNKAAAIMKALMSQLIDEFRLGIKGVIITLNLADPNGKMAKIFAEAKDAIADLNEKSKKLAKYIGNAALVVALVKELNQIINWIKSLPAQAQALIKNCLTTFQNAVKQATNQIKAIPGQVSSNLLGAFSQLQQNTESAISAAKEAQASANVPNTIISIINSPETANMNALTMYISSQYPNTNVIISQTEAATFNVSNTSTP